jgi:hypothetical protein
MNTALYASPSYSLLVKFSFVGFEVLTLVIMKCTIFWVVTDFLLGLFLNPEDGGNMFF